MRDTRKPVRPKTVYSMVAYSSVMLPGVRWSVASPMHDRCLEDRAPDGRSEHREQTRLLLARHVVAEGPDAADLDLHHVPRPHVRGRALRPQPDDVPRVERAVPADFGNMAGGVEEHVPGVELDLDLAINTNRGLQVVGVEIRGDPGAHRLEGIRVLGPAQGAVLDLPGALADIVADGVAQDTTHGVLWRQVRGLLADHRHQVPLHLELLR